jgi:hypothetical protein
VPTVGDEPRRKEVGGGIVWTLWNGTRGRENEEGSTLGFAGPRRAGRGNRHFSERINPKSCVDIYIPKNCIMRNLYCLVIFSYSAKKTHI